MTDGRIIQSFKKSDVNEELVIQRAQDEYERLIENPDNFKDGLTNDDIYANCIRGQYAEVWLLENGYCNDNRMYCDVLNKNGEPVEVKVAANNYANFLHKLIERCIYRKREMRDRYASNLYVFINQDGDDEYIVHGTYKWDQKQKIFKPKTKRIVDI